MDIIIITVTKIRAELYDLIQPIKLWPEMKVRLSADAGSLTAIYLIHFMLTTAKRKGAKTMEALLSR